MIDTKAIKPEDNKGGTFTQLLSAGETTTAYVSPVPSEAPGVITAEPGTSKEEAIYYKSKDAGAGTISGLTRDFTNLNGGTGQEHSNGEDWEVFQSARYITNLIDILLEGFIQEQQTIAKVDASNFTVEGNASSIYSVGRVIRCNQDNSYIGVVTAVSYSAGTGLTTITISGFTVPTLTHVEYGLGPKGFAFSLIEKIQSGEYVYAADTGSADTYAVAPSPANTAYTVGMIVLFKAANDNTGASTLNVNGLGAKSIKKNVSDDLESGDILEDQLVIASYDGTNFQLIGGNSSSASTGGWTDYTDVIPTRASADDPTYVMTFAGVDLTDQIGVGMRVKWTQNSTVRYGIVTAISFSTNTTLTIYGGTDYDVEDTGTYAISGFAYSREKSPLNFPMDPTKWRVRVATGRYTKSSPTAGTYYASGLTIDVPIGAWDLYYKAGLQCYKGGAGDFRGFITLSSNGTSETDSDFTNWLRNSGSDVLISLPAFGRKFVTHSSKTTWEFLVNTSTSGMSQINVYGDNGEPVIVAQCAYL